MKYTSSEKPGNLVNNALQEAGEYGQDLFQEVFNGIFVMYTECEEDQIDVHDRVDELVELFEKIFRR